MNEELMPRKTLTQLVNAWNESTEEIRQAFSLLVSAEKRLKENFKPDSYLFDLDRTNREYRDYAEPERLIKQLKKDAWRSLIDRMDLRRLLSIKRAKDLDDQLEKGEDLPEIEEATILNMIEGTAGQLETFMEEAVKEVFEFLRPHHSHLKTNSEFEVGKRVILGWMVEHTNYGQEKWRVNYNRTRELTALTNVFHILDGKPISDTTYRGELVDAIESCDPTGKGETFYFKFQCYRNNNLHLEFKRLDLVARLNQVAGGARLRKQPEPKKEATTDLVTFNKDAGAAQEKAKQQRANEIVGELGMNAAGPKSIGSVEGSPLFGSAQESLF